MMGHKIGTPMADAAWMAFGVHSDVYSLTQTVLV